MSRFLVTGGTGFIGRALCRRLRADGHQVVAVGRGSDLTIRDAALRLFADAGAQDYVIHLADISGDAQWSASHAAEQFLANHYMAIHVIDAWIAHQPQARLVGMSTLWAYPEDVVDAREETYWSGRMHEPTEHYGLAKKVLGVGIQAARKQRDMKGTMLVLGNVYGPDDSTFHIIPSLVRRMRANPERLEIWGDGSQTRDFIYVDDQVEGIVRHVSSDEPLLNIGSGTTHTVRDVVDTLTRLLPYHGAISYDATKAAGVNNRKINVARATEATGWPGLFPLHTLEAGLAKTLAAAGTC